MNEARTRPGEARTWPGEPPTERRRELNRRLRLAFIAGSDERFWRERGRGLTAEELRLVLPQYPGDLPEARSLTD